MMWGNAGQFRRERKTKSDWTSSSGASGSCESETASSTDASEDDFPRVEAGEDDFPQDEDSEDDLLQPKTLDISRHSYNFGKI